MMSTIRWFNLLTVTIATYLIHIDSFRISHSVRSLASSRIVTARSIRGFPVLQSSRSSSKSSRAPKEREEGWDLDDNTEMAKEELEEEEEVLGIQADVNFKSGFVSILGNPNVGKSTLLNAFLGETLCIVSPKPQTTRHRILGVLTEKSYQLVFSDTPGMMEPVYKLQEAMMDSVRGAVGDADVIVLVSDVYGEPLADAKIMQKLAVTSRPILVVLNKVDLLRGDNAIGGQKETDESEPVSSSVDTYNGNDVRTPEAKMSFKKKLLQRKRDAMLQEEQSAVTAGPDSSTSGIIDPESISAAVRDIESGDVSVTVAEPVKAGAKAFQGNTEYAEYKDEYNEQEGGDARNWKGTVRSEASEKHLKAKSMIELENIWKQRLPRAEIVAISARNKVGVEELLAKVVGYMAQGPKYFTQDTLTNRDERFFTAEIIREAVFHSYKDEIPYSCEVVIDSFKDKTPQLSVIEACIVISKDSQKAILIGKGGSKLKELGTLAREKLEKFLDRKVFLSIHVRVDEDWRASTDSLTRYGYVESDFG